MEGFNQTPITPESNEPTADQLRVRLADLRKQMEMFGDVTAADRAEVERLAALISSKTSEKSEAETSEPETKDPEAGPDRRSRFDANMKEIENMIRRGDTVVSKSGTSRIVEDIVMSPDVEGGGAIVFTTTKAGKTFPERLTFHQFLDGKRSIAHIEKASKYY